MLKWLKRLFKRKPAYCYQCKFWDNKYHNMKNYPFERCECHIGPEYIETRLDWWCSHFKRRK